MPLEWSEEVYEAAKARVVEATQSDEEHLKNHLRLDDREASSIFEDLGLSYEFIDEAISMRQFTKTNTQTAQNFYEGLAKSANYLNIMMEPNALFYAVAIEDTDVATMDLDYMRCKFLPDKMLGVFTIKIVETLFVD